MRAVMGLVIGLVVAGGAIAAEPAAAPATVALPTAAPRVAGVYRVKTAVRPAGSTLRLNDPRSMLRSAYGGSMVDLYPFEGGKFHLSGGGKLFGRAGRPRPVGVEALRYLPAMRGGGLRTGRRFSPAMLVGYGRTVDQGLTFGVDAGVVIGRLGATPDRFGRLNRRRLESVDGRGRRSGMNQLARVTALYRF